jgi:Rieske Fe-S protein
LPEKSPVEKAEEEAQSVEDEKVIARSMARLALAKRQLYMGICLFLSAILGIFLLATDRSLWILAVSHAYGLVAIVGIDLLVGLLSLLFVKQVYILSIVAAVFGVMLQVGDLATAPQYGMTIAYFASYLFSLWAFDALLVTQLLVIFLGLFNRVYVRTLTERGRYHSAFSASRRDFLKAMLAFGGIVALASVFSIIRPSKPSLPTTTTTTTTSRLPAGAVANISQVQSGSPVYFEYPTGYPNILLKKNDGSLIALSMLCTHLCCQLAYESNGNQLWCECHNSLFDENGNVINGPAIVPLPSVQITTDSNGNVFPQKVNGSSPCIQG